MMTDQLKSQPDELVLPTAAFLQQVLDLEDDPSGLAGDLSAIKRDNNAAIYTIQLESSVGLAAFLVYTYVLGERGGDGHTGQELFDAGLETLQQAAQRNTPGPRAVAHASTEEHGFILATTPGTYRALTGSGSAQTLEPGVEDLIATEDTDRIRSEAAEELLDLLQRANAQAQTWLRAIQSATMQAPGTEEQAVISFSEAETELALFLLDDESIGDLLRSLNLLVATAQEQTQQALGEMDLPGPDDSSPTDAATGTWPRRN
jgi:hypothetical protein